MEDVGKIPEAHHLSPATEPASIPTLDGWIENLVDCKQLAENDVQRLCERVGIPESREILLPLVQLSTTDLFLGQRSIARGVKCTTSCKSYP